MKFYYGISTKTNEKGIRIRNYSPLTEKVLTECPCISELFYVVPYSVHFASHSERSSIITSVTFLIRSKAVGLQ